MGTIEDVKGVGKEVLTRDEQLQVAAAQRAELDARNEKIRAEREKSGGSKVGVVVKPGLSSFGVMGVGGLADEFKFANGVLDEINDGRSNTLKADAYLETNDQNNYVTLQIPKWERTTEDEQYEGESDDEVRLILNGKDWDYEKNGETPFSLPFPIDEGQAFPIDVQLTPRMLEKLASGINSISYFVTNNGVGNRNESLEQLFYIDRTPPSPNVDPQPLGLPAGITEPGVISKEYLDANTTVTLPVPDYPAAWEGDTIQVYEFGTDIIIYEGVLWPEGDPERALGVPVSSAALLALGAGPKQLVFKLKDRTGLSSGTSRVRPISIQLAPRPARLQAPLVPQSPIDREDARRGVAINIPSYDNSNPNDDIEVTLESSNGSITLPLFKYSVGTTSVGWSILANPDPRGVYTAKVTYKVLRGTDIVGPSPINNVPVDLRVVGPINPEEPGPVNPELTKLTVFGGAGTSPENEITTADADKPASIRFTVYEGATAGHIVHFFYNGVEVTGTNAPLTISTEAEGDIVSVELPWETIKALGNGTFPTMYQVFENSTTTNYQQSVDTDVNVTANTVAVGNYIEYDYGTIPAAKQNKRPGSAIRDTGILNCLTKPWNGVKLKIRFAAGEVLAGDIIRLNWVFYRDALATVEAPSTLFEMDVRVPAGAAARTISFTVPYQPRIFGEDLPPLPGKPPHVPNLNEGAIVCNFTLIRGTVTGVSPKTMVRYSTNEGGVACSAWGNA